MKKETELEDSFPKLDQDKFRPLAGAHVLGILEKFCRDKLDVDTHPKELSRVILKILEVIEVIIIDQQVIAE